MRFSLVAIPLVALLVAPAFIASTEPRFLGMPPIMWWILLWVALTPLCLYAVGRLRQE